MFHNLRTRIIILGIFICNHKCDSSRIKYPIVERNNSIVELYNGYKVEFPYKWMENTDNSTIDKVQSFIQDQGKLTKEFVSNCKNREHFIDMFAKNSNFVNFGKILKRGDKMYYEASTEDNDEKNWYVLNITSWTAAPGTNTPEVKELGVDATVLSPNGDLVIFLNKTDDNIKLVNISGNEVVEVEDVSNLNLDLDPQKVTIKPNHIAFLPNNTGFYYVSVRNHSNETESNKIFSIKYRTISAKTADIKVVELDKSNENMCKANATCIVEQIDVTNDGNYIYVATLNEIIEVGEVKRSYNFNLVKPNLQNTTETVLLNLGSEIDLGWHTLNDKTLNIVKDGKFYFLNKNAKPFRITEVTLANFTVDKNMTDIYTPPDTEIIHKAIGIGGDKMLLEIESMNEKPRDFSKLELRYLVNGSLIWEYPRQPGYGGRLSVYGNSGESDALVTSFLGWANYPDAIYLLNPTSSTSNKLVRTRFEDVVPAIVTYYSTAIKRFQPFNQIQATREHHSVAIMRQRNFTVGVSPPAPTFIFLQGFTNIDIKHVALVKDYGGIIVFHRKLFGSPKGNAVQRLSHVSNEVTNVVEIGEALISQGYASKDNLYLMGTGTPHVSTLAANIVKARVDLFAGVMMSGPYKLMNTANDQSCEEYHCAITTLCQDGHVSPGNETGTEIDTDCSKPDAEVFDLYAQLNPLFSMEETFNITHGSSVNPSILLNWRAFYKDTSGLQYLAAIQHALENGEEKQTNPALLSQWEVDNSDFSDMGHHGMFNQLQDFLCIIGSSGNSTHS